MMRVLVVDDDDVISKVLAVMLQRADFEVDLAENGVKGVEMWENGNYDLVLMDVQMPRMNGFEATRAIREKEGKRGGHTPIVAVTAYALQQDEEQCLAAGMDAYISKPVDFKKLLETIRRLIG
jgi:CheY-like chemotaxis protein